ncbi:putative vacuolar calcium ion transporter [Talaromyces proteolyticus]|uniref:Vacuolar calcium ion transporter n=1 Tax=Talaromyces proteolyticus TaxID=1131652 RepID=A0AAD4KTW6_9EURO|nr:putative vacuolar calcium ion transporter [Talaromyces proteolyticus]KAH8699196.1 putative vacuolar calcium ion transporter [Talaromyces proteolyticus]
MSAEDSPNQEPGPTTPLLNRSTPSSAPRSGRNSLLKNATLETFRIIKVVWFQSIVNWFLFLVPVALVASTNDWDTSSVFVLNFLAILALSSVLSFATDELAKSTGQTLGALVNATFGNALEMIVGITAVRQGEIRIVQSSMVGSILSGILLILGCTFFFGCYNKEDQKFNADVIGVMISLMVVSCATLIIPSALGTMTPWKRPELDDSILSLSRATAIVLIIFYLVYLYFQLRSHADIFDDSNTDPDQTLDNEVQLSLWPSSIILLLATLGVTFCSDALVDSVDGIVETWHISRAFIGLIIVPIVGNAGEFTAAVSAARAGKMGLGVSLIVSATLQISLFVTPFLVICGWIIGKPMSLYFNTFETVVLSFSVIVVNCLVREGQANYLEGILLMGTYVIVGIAFYVHPQDSEVLIEGISGYQ